ncbi:MAG: TetR/AcrR family transcriptional regulator [Burkholderiaceae bacterium]|nr:TetR/AcrR family transcriptional regulator [Burkholderiaceae bacterium]
MPRLDAALSASTKIPDNQGAFVPNYLPIPGPSDDARSLRTRDAVGSALISLMLGRAYDEVSIQDICDRADIGRSTFYAHFRDKDDIFIRHTVAFARALGRELCWDTDRCYSFPVRQLLEHVREMRGLFDSLSKACRSEFIMTVIQNNFAEVFEERVGELRAGAAGSIPAAILAQHLASTLMTLLRWWMTHHEPLDSLEMEKQWTHLVAGLR